ncbi:unnamed protein product [Ranitomeya imitator]|uniref:Uncharacterized protein n=1 Tax=Ranitomeya imitator TaxID=111125 RepID=A0ABN9L1B0_9NEOB|nr:unnamed protein product [Ranitomeya imitator]
MTSSSCLHAADPAQAYFVCPVEGRAKYCSAQAPGKVREALRTAVFCSALNRADKVRLRRSVKTRRGRHLIKIGGAGPRHPSDQDRPWVGTGATVATLADASELPTTVTVAQVNYSTVSDGEVEQNWATLQGGEMTIQTTQASEATQAVASLAEAAVAASHDMAPGATVTMALNSEAAAHAVATLAEATLQGGGQIVLSGETAAAVGALTGVQDANGNL